MLIQVAPKMNNLFCPFHMVTTMWQSMITLKYHPVRVEYYRPEQRSGLIKQHLSEALKGRNNFIACGLNRIIIFL